MSFYNTMNGVNTVCVFFVLPMLDKHPDEYPRFRDCFLSDEEHPEYNNHIHVYTRTGGGNRQRYMDENKEITEHPNFVTDFDDSFDSTYASWVFSVPEKWKPDFDKIISGDLKSVSPEYQAKVRKTFPQLKNKMDELWST